VEGKCSRNGEEGKFSWWRFNSNWNFGVLLTQISNLSPNDSSIRRHIPWCATPFLNNLPPSERSVLSSPSSQSVQLWSPSSRRAFLNSSANPAIMVPTSSAPICSSTNFYINSWDEATDEQQRPLKNSLRIMRRFSPTHSYAKLLLSATTPSLLTFVSIPTRRKWCINKEPTALGTQPELNKFPLLDKRRSGRSPSFHQFLRAVSYFRCRQFSWGKRSLRVRVQRRHFMPKLRNLGFECYLRKLPRIGRHKSLCEILLIPLLHRISSRRRNSSIFPQHRHQCGRSTVGPSTNPASSWIG
jgi:hypothetical protein